MRLWQRSLGGVPILDAVIAAVLVVGAAGTVLDSSWSARVAAELVVSCLTAGSVIIRRRSPRVMAGLFSVGLVSLAALDQGGTTMWAFVALLVVSFSLTSELPPRSAAWAVLALLVAGIAYDATLDHNGIGSVISPVVIVGAPALAGIVVRRSREQAAELARVAADLAAQQEAVRAAAVLGERTRIARELHDVIAHTVGVMVVQAGAVEKQLPAGAPSVDAVRAIRHTGKEAMQELRRVVGLLRTADDVQVEPQPGLDALVDLIAAARCTCAVEADIDPTLVLPPGMALTAYRTVQEALTNAQRHAPGAAVSVSVGASGQELRVTVLDEGAPQPVARDVVGDAPGFGLIGIRERAALYGGHLEAGPRPGRAGWQVCLRLPMVREEPGRLTWPAPQTAAAAEPA